MDRVKGVVGRRKAHTFRAVEAPRLAETLLRLHLKLEEHRGSLEADAGLLNVFEQLAELHGVPSPGLPDARPEKELIRRVRDYIEAYYPRNISLADLSTAVETSPFHLLRTFRREVGLTPHGYLIQVRVEAAKRLLRSRTGIADVAGRTGFTDQSHLTRHFKRLTGVTPNRYRP
ncbi:MAG: helix-turn-helix transcriptional regulator [Acidobacteria bacterium]|nr:helix-turn-helix transcriptional regulator [Acidobacteriota bacterium]